MASTKKRKATGDCFEAAGRHMLDYGLQNQRLRLVHGEVMGQGKIHGVQFGHAWILDGNTVFDPSMVRNIVMPRAVYYALGKIDDIGNVFEYTYFQMLENINKYKHWGPWDLVTSTGY